MNRRSTLLPIIALFTLLIAACGVEPSPGATPDPTTTSTSAPAVEITANCLSTAAYSLEHIVAVIGVDPVPTAFDAINGGSCQLSEPISELRITLTGANGSQVAVYAMPGASEFGTPLPDQGGPTLLATLAPGRYERTVVAVAADGREAEVQGFEPVILVYDTSTTQAQLLRAESRWERSSIRAYTFTIAWSCFCLPEYVAEVDVEVQDGQVLNLSFVDPKFAGQEVPNPERFRTIDGLLAVVQGAIDSDAASIRADFHEQLGYPVEVFIDYEAMMADEEQGFSVSNLRY